MPKQIEKESTYWDNILENESLADFENDLKKSEIFSAQRPPKVNVTLRLDPLDLSLIKRKANKLGLPHSQLIASIVHQSLLKEKAFVLQ